MKTRDITLIIPTFERPEHLKRKLYHLNTLNCNIPIKIYDSSSEEVAKKNKKTVEENKDKLDLKFFKTKSNLGYIQKVFYGIKNTRTKYVVIHSDDDFLVVDTILKCRNFLDNSINYSNCTGISLKLDRHKGNVLTMTSSNDIQDHSDPLQRAKRIFQSKKDKITIYNVWRTKSLLDVLEPISKTPYLKYSEYFLGILSAFNGPTKLLNELYEIKTIENLKSERRKKSLPDFEKNKYFSLLNNDFYDDIKKFINTSIIFLKIKKIKEKNFEEMILKIFIDKFFTSQKNRKKKYFYFITFKRILKKIKYLGIFFSFRKIDLTIKMVLLYGVHKTLFMINSDKNFEYNIFALKNKKSKYFNFFNSVEKCIMKFPNL